MMQVIASTLDPGCGSKQHDSRAGRLICRYNAKNVLHTAPS